MKKTFILLALQLAPVVALAQNATFDGGIATSYFGGMLTFVNTIVIPVIIAAALLIFIWGMFQYFILGAADEEKRAKGKQLIIWGLLGFVVMFSLVGIINLLVSAFGLSGQQLQAVPQVLNPF